MPCVRAGAAREGAWRRTEMPPQTADRLWGELGKAHIVDLNGGVVPTGRQPEDTFLELTIMKD